MLSLVSVMVGATVMFAEPPPTGPAPSVPAAGYALLTSPKRRVRAPDPRLQALIAEGFSRSSTFAGLVTALNRTDVIVYIEPVVTLPKDTMGRIAMLPLAGTNRYLRIQIRADLPRKDAIALIGHELQHALEIAEAPEVRNDAGMVKLYERIGYAGTGGHNYDTGAAQDTGRRVRRELAG
jgi:hypothetical protein